MICRNCGEDAGSRKSICSNCGLNICQEYITNKKSTNELSLKYNVDHQTIINIIRRNGFELRSNSKAAKLAWTPERQKEQSKRLKGHKRSEETKKKIGDAHRGKITSEETKKKISKSLKGKCTGRKHSEETKRKMSKNRRGLTNGPKHPNWKGNGPYCYKFNDEFKERVRDFFGRRCVMSGITEEQNGRRLDVHHVDYHKKALCRSKKEKFNSCPNLFVPVSISWNAKFERNREYWEEMLSNWIMIYYDGECYIPKEGLQ